MGKLSTTLLTTCIASIATAQWNVVAITPPGYLDAEAHGVSGGKQCGFAGGSLSHAVLWSGTATSYVDLNPAGASISIALSVATGSEGGFIRLPDSTAHAGIWHGTAASFVDLNPPLWANSEIVAISDSQQVGVVFSNVGTYAALWSGSPGSFVELNPPGAELSEANSVWNGYQAGIARLPGGPGHAALWHGTPESFVDLNPPLASESNASCIAGGQESGDAVFDGADHAVVWTGTASSYVDLNPIGFGTSDAIGCDGVSQVGFVTDADGHIRAALWTGTAASFVDLSTYAHGYTDTIAFGVDGRNIVGRGTNIRTGHTDALRWIPLPSPVSATAHGH